MMSHPFISGAIIAMASKSATADIALFSDLVRAETRLYNLTDAVLRERHGIVTSQFEFLRWIRDHDGARIADLAAAFAVGLGAVSKAVDRYEAAGWAQRRPHPDDRRSALLVLTPAGRELVDAAETTFAARVDEVLAAALDPVQRRALGDAVAALRAHLEHEGLGRPIG
jgi:MarR family transcriptional regulator, multiple antibiotic resistance protein MarR